MKDAPSEERMVVQMKATYMSYMLLCGMWLIPFCAGLLALQRNQAGLLIVGCALFAAVVTAFWLSRFLIILTQEKLIYRSLFRHAVVFDISRLSKADVVTGYRTVLDLAKPFLRLEIEGAAPDGTTHKASINLRVFGRSIGPVVKELRSPEIVHRDKVRQDLPENDAESGVDTSLDEHER